MLKCIRYSTFMLSIFCLITGITMHDYNWILFCDLFLLIQNIIFSFERIKSRILFLAFQGTMFLFLLSRPTIGFLRGNNWQYSDDGQMIFSLGSIGISLLFMMFGAICWEEHREKTVRKNGLTKKKNPNVFKERYIIILRNVSLVLYLVSFVSYMMIQMDKVLFMRGKDYVDFYTTYESNMNSIVYLLSSYMPCAMAIYLSTMPKKKPTFCVLALFLISEIPLIAFGKRSQLMLNTIFILMYYFIRDFSGDKEKWIGKIEKMLLVICIPLCILLLGAMNYTRSGKEVTLGLGALIVDFFFKQGVSFNVLNIAHAAIPNLPDRAFSFYSIGNFVDYILHGTIAQKLFGAVSLGTGNNVIKATQGHVFAHCMSYVTRGQEYLDGNGWGSSYLLETYVDFGWIGVIVYSVLLGILLIALIDIVKKRNLLSVIALMSLINLYFTPRGGATEFLEVLIRPKFWMPVIFCYFVAGLLTRHYSFSSLKSDEYTIKSKEHARKMCEN